MTNIDKINQKCRRQRRKQRDDRSQSRKPCFFRSYHINSPLSCFGNPRSCRRAGIPRIQICFPAGSAAANSALRRDAAFGSKSAAGSLSGKSRS